MACREVCQASPMVGRLKPEVGMKWISVSERLPEKNQRVWAHFEGIEWHSGVSWRRSGEHVAVWWGEESALSLDGGWSGRFFRQAMGEIGASDKVHITHWMPLPDPPEDA